MKFCKTRRSRWRLNHSHNCIALYDFMMQNACRMFLCSTTENELITVVRAFRSRDYWHRNAPRNRPLRSDANEKKKKPRQFIMLMTLSIQLWLTIYTQKLRWLHCSREELRHLAESLFIGSILLLLFRRRRHFSVRHSRMEARSDARNLFGDKKRASELTLNSHSQFTTMTI